MGSYWCFFSAAAAVPGPGRASIAASVGAQKFSLSLSLGVLRLFRLHFQQIFFMKMEDGMIE